MADLEKKVQTTKRKTESAFQRFMLWAKSEQAIFETEKRKVQDYLTLPNHLKSMAYDYAEKAKELNRLRVKIIEGIKNPPEGREEEIKEWLANHPDFDKNLTTQTKENSTE